MDSEKIYLRDVLPLNELAKRGNIVLVRHKREFLQELIDLNLLERYQSFQNMPSFRNCTIFISFIAEANNQAKLYGIYENIGIQEKENLPTFDNDFLTLKSKPQNQLTDFYMELKPLEEFNKYKHRVIINWGLRLWYANFKEIKDKEVIKILPRDFVEEFPGIMKISVSAIKLKSIILKRQTEWFEALTRLQAVYLILDQASGLQYIGTTYGAQGLWQRWENYVKTDFTGDNLKLIELKKNDINFSHNLQFSILETLPKNANQKDCSNAESTWKRKLGSRTFGLNDN